MNTFYKYITMLIIISSNTSSAMAENSDIIVDLSGMSWAGKPEKVNVALIHEDGNMTLFEKASGKFIIKEGPRTSAKEKTYFKGDGPFRVYISAPVHKVVGRCSGIVGAPNGAEVVVSFENTAFGPVGYICKSKRGANTEQSFNRDINGYYPALRGNVKYLNIGPRR